jgi:transposase InsO family protein
LAKSRSPSSPTRSAAYREKVFAAAGGPPKVLRMDNGPELVSQALQQFCTGKVGLSYIPPGTPWNNGYIESFNNRLRKECLNRNHWNTLFEARVVSATSKTNTTTDTGIRPWATEHRPSTLPDAPTPTTPWWPARSTKSGQQKPGSKSGWTHDRGLASPFMIMDCSGLPSFRRPRSKTKESS